MFNICSRIYPNDVLLQSRVQGLSVKPENIHSFVSIVQRESANIMQNIVEQTSEIKLSTKPHLAYHKLRAEVKEKNRSACKCVRVNV